MKKKVAIIGAIALLSFATPAAISAAHSKSDELKPSVTSPYVIGAVQNDVTSSVAPVTTPPEVTPGIAPPPDLSTDSQENQSDDGDMNPSDDGDVNQSDDGDMNQGDNGDD